MAFCAAAIWLKYMGQLRFGRSCPRHDKLGVARSSSSLREAVLAAHFAWPEAAVLAVQRRVVLQTWRGVARLVAGVFPCDADKDDTNNV